MIRFPFSGTPVAKGRHFLFPFLTDQTCGLGILAAYGLIIARPQYRAQFQLQNYPVPMNDVMVPYNPLGKFSHLTPEVGGAGLGHIQAQTKWQCLDCNQVITAK